MQNPRVITQWGEQSLTEVIDPRYSISQGCLAFVMISATSFIFISEGLDIKSAVVQRSKAHSKPPSGVKMVIVNHRRCTHIFTIIR